MHLSTMQHKDSPSQYNVVQILPTWVFQTLKTSNLYLFDKCSIWDNVWAGNLIFFCVFFFWQTGRRASTHGASGKRSKVSVIVHRTTSPLRMCVIAWHHKLCLSVCVWLVCPLYTTNIHLECLHWDIIHILKALSRCGTLKLKKRILLKGFFRSRIVCVYKSTWFS